MILELHSQGKYEWITYEKNLYSITFGDAEDLIKAVDIDSIKFSNSEELEKGILSNIKDTIHDVLPIMVTMFGASTEDIKHVSISELVNVISKVISFTLSQAMQLVDSNENSKGSCSASLFENLFDMQITLCDRFQSLSPFTIRQQPIKEVFLLAKRLKDSNKTEEKKVVSNNEVIRRPATDDSWY